MQSEKQRLEKEQRIKHVVDSFLKYEDVSINQLSRLLKIPSSTIQRDLNDVDYISAIYGVAAKEKLLIIRDRLKKNKEKGTSRGGIISTTINEPVRDENGKFTGNKKR